jgi:hypothetical protein
MSKNLVELMKHTYLDSCIKHSQKGDCIKFALNDVLSVVKEHIGEVAQICPCVHGWATVGKLEINKHCLNCKGTGIITRTDKEGTP